MDGPLSLEGRHEYMKSIKYKLLSFNVEIWLYAVKTEGQKLKLMLNIQNSFTVSTVPFLEKFPEGLDGEEENPVCSRILELGRSCDI